MSSPPSAARTRARHPLPWWIWAGGVAVALTRVSNPLVLLALTAGVAAVAGVCRRRANTSGDVFSRTLEASLVLGGVIILVRTGFHILVGFPDSSPVLLRLPAVDLPWFTNLHLLGPIHTAGLLHAVFEGVRLGGLVITFGAASAVSNPRRALRFLPSSLHHLGTSAVIAVSTAPQLIASVGRVRRAQRLRAPAPRSSRLRALAAVLIPVLAGALDQALTLAGSMDSRGYARATTSTRGVGTALVIALLAGAAGTYGLLDTTTPRALGAWLLLGGAALAVGASVVASRSVRRTRYWATPWGWQETLIAASGAVLAALALLAGDGLGPWRPGGPWLPLPGVAMLLACLAPMLTRPAPDRRWRVGWNRPEGARRARPLLPPEESREYHQ